MFRIEQQCGDPLLLPPDLSVLIGRGNQCDLQLSDPAASRVHCRVMATQGKVHLIDAGSRWGTFVNGHRIVKCDLRHGDQIRVGKTLLWLVIDGHPEQVTLAPQSELHRPGKISRAGPFSPPGYSCFNSRRDNEISGIDSNPEATDCFRVSPKHRSRHPEFLQPADFLGRTFHRYRPQQILASASTGVVFRATEEESGKMIALKIFHPPRFVEKTARQRFERAVRTTVRQKHANIVELFNAGQWKGLFFTASQFIDGESAVNLIQKIGVARMLDPAHVLAIADDICNALYYLEKKRIVHRNILPSNILISKSDCVAHLNDVTIAKASDNYGYDKVTQPGTILGEVAYMSPELLGSGYPIDCRSDIYQLGATLYALLTGRPPFEHGSITEMLTRIMGTEPQPVQIYHMATPYQLAGIVRKMLQTNPRDRFQNAAELSSSLKKVAAQLDPKNFRSRMIDAKATGWRGALDGF